MTLEGYDGCGALQPAEWWTDRCKVCHHSLMLHKDVISDDPEVAPMMVCDMCALAADVAIALKEHVREVDYNNRKDTEAWMKQRMPAVIVERVKEESLKEEPSESTPPSEPSEPVAAEPVSEPPSAEPSETAPSTPSEPAPSPESPASSGEPSTTSSTTPKK